MNENAAELLARGLVESGKEHDSLTFLTPYGAIEISVTRRPPHFPVAGRVIDLRVSAGPSGPPCNKCGGSGRT
jgi:hypothetical protein